MTKTLPPLAQALRTARARAGVTQHELARHSKVARITIASIELGKYPTVRSDTVEKLARSLGIEPGELLEARGRTSAIRQTAPTDKLLTRYQRIHKGTSMAAKAAELGMLREMMDRWAAPQPPTEASVLFLLLALRHAGA